jgi:osmotically-inducible protein OsmY
MEVDASVLPPRAYVFVEERQFLQPVRPTTVVVNNTTIINKTVNITNIKVVNKTVINEGPPAPAIERVSGRKVQAVPARGLRHQQEAEAVAKQPITTPIREREGHPPARNEAEPRTIQTQKDADRRAMDAENKARVEAEQRGADQRVKAAQKQAQQEADQRAIEAEKKARFEAEQRGTDQRVKAAQKQAQQEADQRAIEAEKKARFEAEQRGADQRENRDVQTKSKGHAKAQDDDQATISRVKKALAADSQLNGVNAEVAQGMVRLSGVVDTRGQKNKAGAIANKVEGVRGVQNGITVKEDRP